MSPMQGIKNKILEKEAEAMGDQWLGEVREENSFKSLEEWRSQFEPAKPKKEDNDKKKKMKANVATKAKEKVLDSVHKTLTHNLTQTVLEVTSTILSKLEDQIPSKEVPAAVEGVTAAEKLPQIFNTLNGIVLTYRFGNGKMARKFVHIRKVACDDLTALIVEEKARLSNIQQQLRKMLKSSEQREKTKEFVAAKIDALIAEANERMNEKVESSMAELDEKVAGIEMAANQAEAVLAAAGIQRPENMDFSEARETTKEKVVDKTEEMMEAKDAMVNNIATMLKSFVISKLEPLTDMISQAFDSIFVAFTLASHKFDFAKQGEEVCEEVGSTIDRMYKKMEATLSKEIKKITDTLGAMMQEKIDEEFETEGS